MLSDRARGYLATLKRVKPVATTAVERALKEYGEPCYPAWLEFHERYAGYVEPLGLELAVFGIVHERSRWISPGRVAVEQSYESRASRFVMCAEVHPSYVYKLGDTGFFREPAASSFEVKLERTAARVAFLARRGAKVALDQAQIAPFIEQLDRDAREVPEGSDEHYRLLLGERHYALRETESGRVVDCGVCD